MSGENIPASEPRQIVIGSTLKWTREFCGYPATEYSLTYYFRGVGKGFDAEADADPSDADRFAVTVPAATTADMSPGAYYWQAVATRDGEKLVVGEGEAKAVAGLAGTSVTAAVDGRSQAKKILDAIDALLANKATRDQQEYTVGDGDSTRMLKRILPSELIELRKTYARIVSRELRRDRVRRGGPLFSSVKVRFERPR